jgi:hypothetical protein
MNNNDLIPWQPDYSDQNMDELLRACEYMDAVPDMFNSSVPYLSLDDPDMLFEQPCYLSTSDYCPEMTALLGPDELFSSLPSPESDMASTNGPDVMNNVELGSHMTLSEKLLCEKIDTLTAYVSPSKLRATN